MASAAATAASKEALLRAAAALDKAEALVITAGAGMSVDSGLPDFRSINGFWRAYPPAQKLGLSFAQVSNPRTFDENPAWAWGFFGHRYQLYASKTPHRGYAILRNFIEKRALREKHFVFTSNVDGHFERAGFSPERIWEVHGTIHLLQAVEPMVDGYKLWDATALISGLTIAPETFLAQPPLPMVTSETTGKPVLARPNILMFGDSKWVSLRTDDQEERFQRFSADLDRHTRLVIVEVGAGEGVPTVRYFSERLVHRFPNASLIRVNPGEPDGPPGTIEVRMGGLAFLEEMDKALALS